MFGLLGTAEVARICGSGYCSRSSASPSDPNSPTTSDSVRALSILEYINAYTLTKGPTLSPDTTTPEGRAIQWLIAVDRGALASNEL